MGEGPEPPSGHPPDFAETRGDGAGGVCRNSFSFAETAAVAVMPPVEREAAAQDSGGVEAAANHGNGDRLQPMVKLRLQELRFMEAAAEICASDEASVYGASRMVSSETNPEVDQDIDDQLKQNLRTRWFQSLQERNDLKTAVAGLAKGNEETDAAAEAKKEEKEPEDAAEEEKGQGRVG